MPSPERLELLIEANSKLAEVSMEINEQFSENPDYVRIDIESISNKIKFLQLIQEGELDGFDKL
jgi:hypothetical protein